MSKPIQFIVGEVIECPIDEILPGVECRLDDGLEYVIADVNEETRTITIITKEEYDGKAN